MPTLPSVDAATRPAAGGPEAVPDPSVEVTAARVGLLDHEADAGEVRSGPSRRSIEFGVAALLIGLAVLVVWDNLRIGADWGSVGPKPGYFPMRIGIAVGLCGCLSLWQAVRDPGVELFATWLQLKRVSQMVVPLTVYVALIRPLGIYVASTIFIAAFMVFAGRYAWWKAFGLAAATNLLLYFVFEIQFKVPLPKGPLEAWLGT